MGFKEFLEAIMYLMATVLMPVIVEYAASYLKAKKAIVTEQFENQKLREYANDAVDCVVNAVMDVNQTFVEALKQSGNFSEDAKEKAFKMAKNKVIDIISEESKNAITMLYKDFDAWLDNQIEVCVNMEKNGTSALRA